MKRKYISLIAMLLFMVLFICGCDSSDETVEIGAWKENMQSSSEKDTPNTKKEEINTSLPDISISTDSLTDLSDTLGEATGDFLQEAKEDATNKETGFFSGIIDALKGFGKEGTQSVLSDTVGTKHTVEKDTGLIKVKLIRVVDGDTLLVHYNGETYIRMIGINTPESVHPDEEKNTESGTEASKYTKNLLKDTEYVWLEFDTDLNDDYDRTLAYVWLSNDKTNTDTMLNAILLKDGYAEVMTIEPNTKYAEVFLQIKEENE